MTAAARKIQVYVKDQVKIFNITNYLAMDIYKDTLIDTAEKLRDLELELQEMIRELAEYGSLPDQEPESEDDDFSPGNYAKLPDSNIAALVTLLQQVANAREQIENNNGIEI